MFKLPTAVAWVFVVSLLAGGCATAPRAANSLHSSEIRGEPGVLRHDVSDFFIDCIDAAARKDFEQDLLKLIEETLPPRESKDSELSIDGDDLVIRMTPRRQVMLVSLLGQLRESRSLGVWVVADLFRFDSGSTNAIRQRLESVAITPDAGTPNGRFADQRKSLAFTDVDDLARAAREQGASVMSMPPRHCIVTQWCYYQVGASPTIAEVRNAQGARVEFPLAPPAMSDGLKLAFCPTPRERRGNFAVRCRASIVFQASPTPIVQGDRIVLATAGRERSVEGTVMVEDRTGVVIKGFVPSRVSSDSKDTEKSVPEPDSTLYLVVRVLEPRQHDPLAPGLFRQTVE